MKIFLTGASGFIGSNLLPELIKKYDVEVLEQFQFGRYGKLDRKVKTYFANLTDWVTINDIIRESKPDIIIHLAAITPVSFSYSHPYEVLQTNYIGTVNLAEAARKYCNLEAFIFAGSSEEYGNTPDRPATEYSRCFPNSPYSCSKLAATTYLQYMLRTYHFPAIIVRATNTYGRLHDTHFFIERVIVQALRGGPVLLGDPKPIRDWMYVSDHVSAYISLLENRQRIIEHGLAYDLNNTIFNVSTGRAMTVGETAELILDIMGYKGEVLWHQIPPRPNDIIAHTIDSTKIRKMTGWIPKVKFEDGIRMLVAKLFDMQSKSKE